jgi:hypothetical protein
MSTHNKSSTAAAIESADTNQPMSIAKPAGSSLDAFRSKKTPGIAGVETLLSALPHHKISDTKDWVRLHPDEENYWSPEYCFVSIPVEGAKPMLHLIVEHLAEQLPSAKVQRFRLALGTVATGNFFLCHVPSQRLDNSFNKTNLEGCVLAKSHWVEVVREEGADRYTTRFSRDPDAFPAPKWPTKSLDELIEVTWQGRMITSDDHPAWLRLNGAKVMP